LGAVTKQKKNKKLPLILLLICIPLLLLVILLISYFQAIQRPQTEIYFEEYFDIGIDHWKSVDAIWLEKDLNDTSLQARKNILKLARKEYLAPYAMTKLQLDQSPQEAFVWQFSVRISKFTDDAVTLSSLVLPYAELTIVANDEGKIGFSRNLFEQPTYSTSFNNKLIQNEWQDISVFINPKQKEVTLFLNNKQILVQTLEEEVYPVHEIWLGAIWLKGGGNYGSPIDIQFDEITLGNDALIPKPSFYEFTKQLVLTWF
jgi:hypothetical protein